MLVELLTAERQVNAQGDLLALAVRTRCADVEQHWSVPITTEQGQRMVDITPEWNGLFGNDPDARRGFATVLYRLVHEEPLGLPLSIRVDDSLWNSGQIVPPAA